MANTISHKTIRPHTDRPNIYMQNTIRPHTDTATTEYQYKQSNTMSQIPNLWYSVGLSGILAFLLAIPLITHRHVFGRNVNFTRTAIISTINHELQFVAFAGKICQQIRRNNEITGVHWENGAVWVNIEDGRATDGAGAKRKKPTRSMSREGQRD